MGPTRDDFEIWKGVKSIATKLSQVHNRKIYSFILRLIPGPGPGTFHFPQPGRCCRLRHDTTSMSMTQNYLSPQQSRHPASAHYLAFYESPFICSGFHHQHLSLFPLDCRAAHISHLAPQFAAQFTVTANPRAHLDPGSPDRWSSRNLSGATLTAGIWQRTPGVICEILSVPSLVSGPGSPGSLLHLNCS